MMKYIFLASMIISLSMSGGNWMKPNTVRSCKRLTCEAGMRCVKGKKGVAKCVNEGPDPKDCECSREISKVCCSGMEYDNECFAKCDGKDMDDRECTDGPCTRPTTPKPKTTRTAPEPCECPALYDPWCCDRKLYLNECLAVCVGIEVQNPEFNCFKGECDHVDTTTRTPDVCACQPSFDPVCCNGVQFDNICSAGCRGIDTETCGRGECRVDTTTRTPDICACQPSFDPVCCNGVQFDNICSADCRGIDTETCGTGECRQTPPPDTTTKSPKDTTTTTSPRTTSFDGCVCIAIYQPWCCDGRNQYSNECEADCKGVDVEDPEFNCQQGECPSQACQCDDIYDPHCCNDVDEYSSACQAFCIDQIDVLDTANNCVKGQCPQVCRCQMDFDQDLVCCGDTSYANRCEAECDARTADECIQGACDACACTKEYIPYCCDGRQYSNDCIAQCAGWDTDNECVQRECDADLCVCAQIYAPVCCTGGQYSNICTAECEGEDGTTCSDGPCRSSGCACPAIEDPVCCNGVDYASPCDAECDSVPAPADDTCDEGTCCENECNRYAPVCCDGNEYPSKCKVECDGMSSADCVDGPCDGLVLCQNDEQCDDDYTCSPNPYDKNNCDQTGNSCTKICVDIGGGCNGGGLVCDDDEICFIRAGDQGDAPGDCMELQRTSSSSSIDSPDGPDP